jgi:hypothetical protein
MLKHRDALFAGLLCLLLAAPALSQTGDPDAPPAPSQRPSDHPKTPHGATWPHNDPSRQRQEAIDADRARRSGEMGYHRDSGPAATSTSGTGEPEPAPASREQAGGEHQPASASRDKAQTRDGR